jgi:myo-inositol-1(or 4)-monophosphatase
MTNISQTGVEEFWASRLAVAIESAKGAGQLLKRKSTRALAVRVKGLNDLVTDADLAAQSLILERVGASFPNDAVLAEEGLTSADLAARTPTWVIDPLDGTINYARRIPTFCVSVACVHAGRIELGVIQDPLRGETFWAQRGRGAFVQSPRRRGQRLVVSPTLALADAVLSFGWPRDAARRQRALDMLGRVGAMSQTLRLTGSAALTIAYVAAGRLDGAFHLKLQPWDLAAGALMVVEAGGRATTLDGGDWRLGLPQVAFSNGHIHPDLIRALSPS